MFCARLFICALWSPAGKGLTSWLSFVVSSVSLSLSHWYPGSGVVLDCIDSWSLHHYLLLTHTDIHTYKSTHAQDVVPCDYFLCQTLRVTYLFGRCQSRISFWSAVYQYLVCPLLRSTRMLQKWNGCLKLCIQVDESGSSSPWVNSPGSTRPLYKIPSPI